MIRRSGKTTRHSAALQFLEKSGIGIHFFPSFPVPVPFGIIIVVAFLFSLCQMRALEALCSVPCNCISVTADLRVAASLSSWIQLLRLSFQKRKFTLGYSSKDVECAHPAIRAVSYSLVRIYSSAASFNCCLPYVKFQGASSS